MSRLSRFSAPFLLMPALVATSAGFSAAPEAGEPLEGWSAHHPEASRELGGWVKAHPQAARLFFEWDGRHPARSKEFVTWTLAHPGLDIDGFAFTHPDWEIFDRIVEKHRPAAQAFMAWARRHRAAAGSLMDHPKGLEWAGHHLYQEAWKGQPGS